MGDLSLPSRETGMTIPRLDECFSELFMIFMLAVLFDKCQMWSVFLVSELFFFAAADNKLLLAARCCARLQSKANCVRINT